MSVKTATVSSPNLWQLSMILTAISPRLDTSTRWILC
jgi:hypothetical protein